MAIRITRPSPVEIIIVGDRTAGDDHDVVEALFHHLHRRIGGGAPPPPLTANRTAANPNPNPNPNPPRSDYWYRGFHMLPVPGKQGGWLITAPDPAGMAIWRTAYGAEWKDWETRRTEAQVNDWIDELYALAADQVF